MKGEGHECLDFKRSVAVWCIYEAVLCFCVHSVIVSWQVTICGVLGGQFFSSN